MTKDKALYAFFSGFGIPAYPTSSVLNENGEPDVVMPYLTYTPVFSSFYGEPVSLTVDIYYRTESEAIPNAKAQEIADYIGEGGINFPCDGGYINFSCGSPSWQSAVYEPDTAVKFRYMNITAKYYTRT